MFLVLKTPFYEAQDGNNNFCVTISNFGSCFSLNISRLIKWLHEASKKDNIL